MSILVGTAFWTDRSLLASKRFYAPGVTSAEARLRYYAARYALVEIDTSYYAMPDAVSAERWVARTPPGFTFNMKAFRLFTGHRTQRTVLPREIRDNLPPGDEWLYRDVPPDVLDAIWAYFRSAVAPLSAARKLGALHFQFAPSVRRSARAIAHLEQCIDRLPGVALAVEFRHASWFAPEARAETLAFLREHQLVNVVVDSPQGFQNSVPDVWEPTSAQLAIVRLHGRNAFTWNLQNGRSSDRFNYDYSDAELAQIAARVRQLAERAATVHVIFNNCWEDNGQRNARTLMDQLGLPAPAAGLDPA